MQPAISGSASHSTGGCAPSIIAHPTHCWSSVPRLQPRHLSVPRRLTVSSEWFIPYLFFASCRRSRPLFFPGSLNHLLFVQKTIICASRGVFRPDTARRIRLHFTHIVVFLFAKRKRRRHGFPEEGPIEGMAARGATMWLSAANRVECRSSSWATAVSARLV